MGSLSQQDLEAHNKWYSVNSWTLLFWSLNFTIVTIPVQSAVFFSFVSEAEMVSSVDLRCYGDLWEKSSTVGKKTKYSFHSCQPPRFVFLAPLNISEPEKVSYISQ